MNYWHYWGYLNYLIVFQVRCEKGIQEKGWAEKCAAMADEIEGLGEGYHDALCYGWVKSLSASYPPGSKRLPLDLSMVQTKVVVEDDDV